MRKLSCNKQRTFEGMTVVGFTVLLLSQTVPIRTSLKWRKQLLSSVVTTLIFGVPPRKDRRLCLRIDVQKFWSVLATFLSK